MLITKFIHLKVHSDYSIKDGLVNPEKLVKQAHNLGMVSLGLTDINNLYGVIKFYSASCSFGLKPIIGIDITIKSNFLNNNIFPLTLLASNNIGYHNIIHLISEAYQKGYKDDIGPVISLNRLIRFKKGILILSGGILGDIGQCLLGSYDSELLLECINFYKTYFLDQYYLEISRIGQKYEEKYIEKIKEISLIYNLPVVATNPVSFLKKKDHYVHKIRVAIYQKKKITDSKFYYPYTKHQYLKSESDILRIFHDFPESLINSVEISKRCNVVIPSGKSFFPLFPLKNKNILQFFVHCVYKGLKNRLKEIFFNKYFDGKKISIYYKRLNYEINIVKKMGFISYFLIVMEFIQWAKKKRIPVGPGRGSGSGSLIAFCLGITELDPIKFDLFFERFLNPDRISLPDFDIDFCMEKRDLVIEHVSEKYGHDSVAQIITFGTMAAKAAIRDVGRVLGYPYTLINKISKLVPLDPKMTLKKALFIQKDLMDLYNKDQNIKILINLSKKLEGVIRNIGKHAGGVVIAPNIISDFVPIFCDFKGKNQITQFDKNDLEFVGLVKFDFLGLKTLTMIDICLKLINKKHEYLGLKNIDINKINLKDKKSFILLRAANTTAVFQLESSGMRDLIRRLKPDSFKDIIALVALFRPGPLQSGMVDNFINRKHGREKISYPDKRWQHILLRDVLKETYGIILYQEQVMKIAQILADYSPGHADILRRAMGKKDPLEMKNQRAIFLLRSKKKGICSHLSEKIFDLLEKFSAYGFNKSHSATYAMISFQTLWLKSNYPEEFMASAMTLDMGNTDKIFLLMQDIRYMKLKILPPNINLSKYGFSVTKDNFIIYGLGAIKGLGKSSIKEIIKDRKKNQCFKSLLNLCIRIPLKYLTRRILERLVMSGSCDCFNISRLKMFYSIKNIMHAAKQCLMSLRSYQGDFFNFHENWLNSTSYLFKYKENIKYQILNPYQLQYSIWERETLGFYFQYHPIKNFLKEIFYYTKGIRLFDLYVYPINKKIIISGLIFSIKVKFTKKKKKFYVIRLDDWYSHFNIIVFPPLSNKIESLLNKKNIIILVKGHLYNDSFSGNLRLISENIINIEEVRSKKLCQIKLFIKDFYLIKKEKLNMLYFYLKKYSKIGTVSIKFIFFKKILDNIHPIFKIKWLIYPSNELLNYLKNFSKYFDIKLHFYKNNYFVI